MDSGASRPSWPARRAQSVVRVTCSAPLRSFFECPHLAKPPKGSRAPKGAVLKTSAAFFTRGSACLCASAHAFRRSTAAILGLGTMLPGTDRAIRPLHPAAFAAFIRPASSPTREQSFIVRTDGDPWPPGLMCAKHERRRRLPVSINRTPPDDASMNQDTHQMHLRRGKVKLLNYHVIMFFRVMRRSRAARP